MKYLLFLSIALCGCHGANSPRADGEYKLVATFKGSPVTISTEPFTIRGDRAKIVWSTTDDGLGFGCLLQEGADATDTFFSGAGHTGEAIIYKTGTFNLSGATAGDWTIQVYDYVSR